MNPFQKQKPQQTRLPPKPEDVSTVIQENETPTSETCKIDLVPRKVPKFDARIKNNSEISQTYIGSKETTTRIADRSPTSAPFAWLSNQSYVKQSAEYKKAMKNASFR